MAIKLLALDIDETLVHDVHCISEANRRAVARAQARGVFVTVATGRGFRASEPIWRAIKVEGPVITYGGAIVRHTVTGELLFASRIGDAVAHELLAYAHERGYHAHVYDGDTVVTEADHPYVRAYTQLLDIPLRIEPDIGRLHFDTVPKLLYMVEPERVEGVIREVTPIVAGRLKISKSSPGFVEFNHPDAHKGAALQFLAQRMGVAREEVAAAGDNTLDLEMLQWAGTGAAMGNAAEAVKAAASVTVPACRDDGVAWFIDNCVLKGG